MTTFSLFGVAYTISPGRTVAAGVTFDWDTTAKTLAIEFHGQVPQGAASFEATFSAAVSGNSLTINGPPISVQQSPVVTFDLGVMRTVQSPKLNGRSDNLGIEFQDNTGTIATALTKWVAGPGWAQMPGGNLLSATLTFDTLGAIHKPLGDSTGTVTLTDILTSRKLSSPPLKKFQISLISTVRTFHDHAEVTARPQSGVLYLHADVLDTSTTDTTPAAPGAQNSNGAPNDLLYQYALANGELLIVAEVSGSGSAAWQARADLPSVPALVFCRWQDEHGHPLAFCPAANSDNQPIRFNLGDRVGVDQEVGGSPIPGKWSQTNSAVVVIENADGSNISGTIQALDPIALYPRYIRPSLLADPFDDPDFIVNGVAPVSGKAPREIHGVADGTWLVVPEGTTTPIPAQFAVTPISSPSISSIFHQSELIIGAPGKVGSIAGWKLATLATEKQFHPNTVDGPAPQSQLVGRRDVPAKATATGLQLPAIDAAFALSNLAGIKRSTSDGKILGDGFITKTGLEWHRTLDGQFSGSAPSHFEIANLDPQTHASGFRYNPAHGQAFKGVLAAPPVSAASTTDTVRTVPSLAQSNTATLRQSAVGAAASDPAPGNPFSATYLFGGDPANANAIQAAQTEAQSAAGNFDPLFKQFRAAWSIPVDSSPAGQAIGGLKTALGEQWRPPTPPADLSGILEQAIAMAASDAAADGLSDEDAEGLNNQLTTMFPEDLASLWTDPGDDWMSGLLERAFSPPTLSLMRRAYTAIWPGLMFFNADQHNPPPPPDQIKNFLATLQNLLPLSSDKAKQLLDFFKNGMPLDIQQGVDALFSELVDLWRTEDDPLGILDSLRARYGAELTPDVYQNILGSANDSALLLQAVNELLSTPLASLANIKTAPPEYLFATKRFPVTGAVPDDGIEALWSAHQPLCQPQDTVNWTFFLDDNTCAIVKLKPGRSVSDIIKEVEANYKSGDRPDPLGFGTADERDKFFRAIDAEVNAPDWLGVFLIEPWIDLSRDAVLRDLAGFDHIDGRYIAVGARRPAGKKPDGTDAPPPVQVWASINKEAPSNQDPDQFKLDPSPLGDVNFSLVKFDVTIAKSCIVAADIVFRVDITDLLGKQKGQQDQSGKTIDFDTIYLKGTLSRPSANGDQQLTFGAWFDTPYKAILDFAFLDKFELHSITVASRNGTTCLEIDGILDLQNPKTDLGFDIDLFDSNGDGGQLSLTMHDFRILLPSLPPGMAMPFGQFRKLSFDFPDLGFQLPHPRAFNVFGVEFIPTGIGYVHGEADAARTALNAAYSWFDSITFGRGLSIPYIEFDIDFGKLPQFGDNDIRGLRLRLAIAFHFTSLSNVQASIGVSGLDATNIKIDFFRLLTLTMDKLAIGPGYSGVALGAKPTGQPNTGIIAALDANLEILGWSPTGGPLSIALAHPMPDPQHPITPALKGAAIWATPNSSGDSFFALHWLLLGHNITLDTKFSDYLLGAKFDSADPSSYKSLPLVEVQGANGKLTSPILHANLTDQESWVFGISFHLGTIFDKCTVVLDDHHYYGIRLYAEWLKDVFGLDVLELAYIAGNSAAQDRFRIAFHVPAFEVLGLMRSGELALEWNPNWDWLIDIGFPWRVGDAYQWDRAFGVPFGCYEARFGFYFEKQSVAIPGGTGLELSAGMGFYLAYAFSAGSSVAWVSAGIGVFAIVQGTVVFEIQGSITDPFAIFKSSIYSLTITGVIGIYAYGEGGIDIWIISARFRVSVQAAIACTIGYTRGAPCSLAYIATLEAEYYASVQVGCGFFSWTFTVSGEVGMDVSGHTMLA